jgi:DNA polymerase-4
MDAFYVSVELMRRPELRGRPVVVSGMGPRAVVTTASYEARKYGVFSAIPASRARRLCPEATFIPPDFEAYRAMSRRVMDRVRAQVETVEVMGLDEAYLELTGLVAPRAAMRRLVSEIKADTGLTASVGIGPNRLVAKVASDAEKPQGFVALTREQACERFAEAPPRLLPGIGPKTAERLESLGIATIARLAATPPDVLIERFGARMGPYLIARARFEDDTPVSNERIAVSESRETTFDQDVAARDEQVAVLRRLTGQLCEGLAKHERRGRTIGIKVRLDDFTTVTRARTIPVATNDPAVVGEVACTLLDEYAPPRPVRLLGVRVAAFEEDAAAAEDAPQMTLAL